MILTFFRMRLIAALKRLPCLALVLASFAGLLPSAKGIIVFPPIGGGGGLTNFTATNIIHFQLTNYFVSEDQIQALITVVREGPLTNADVVSVDYAMTDGTALSGTHYFKSSGTISFFPGQDRVQFPVVIIDNYAAGGDVFLNLVLRNPGSGATTLALLGTPSTATLTIRDDELASSASSSGQVEIAPGNGGAYYSFYETGTYVGTREEWNVDRDNNANFTPYGPPGISVTIVRKGGSRGKILVDWQTTTNVTALFSPIFIFDPFFGGFFNGGGIAVPDIDFTPTNGTVSLDDYQMSTNIILKLPSTLQPEDWFSTNQIAPPSVTFGVELTGVRPAPEEAGNNLNPTLGQAIQRRVAIANVNNGFAFSRLHYTVKEGQRYVRVRVRRSTVPEESNPLGGAHVHYAIMPRLIDTGAHGGDHLNNIFALEPGSDYPMPFIDYEPPGSPVWTKTVQDNNLGPGKAGWVDNEDEATITWGDREVTDKFILIPLIDDNGAEFNEDMQVVLWKHAGETDGTVSFEAGVCVIKIADNDQPAGASEVDFDPDNNPLTVPPYMTVPGANNTVQAVVTQPDGKVILGGDFSKVNTAPFAGIARLNFDGSTDFSFNVGSGIAGLVRALALQPDGKIIVAGAFDSVNGTPRFNIARLLTNGRLDTSFNPGIGTDSAIRTVSLQPDGKILIGGDFNSVNGTNINYIARLNNNGSLDMSFQTGTGPNGPVNSIAVSSLAAFDINHNTSGGPAEDRFAVDTGSASGSITINYDFLSVPDSLRVYYGEASKGGVVIYDSGLINSNGTITVTYPPPGVPPGPTHLEIVMNEGSGLSGTLWFYSLSISPDVDARPVIGGEFTAFNGTPINYIARLTVNGGLDPAFNPGTGADDTVFAVAKQGNKIIMAGDFKQVDLRSRRGVARLEVDGALDTEFDPGTGFDNTVFAIEMQPSGRPVLGGVFRSFNQTRRIGLARLNTDGTLDTSFMDTAKNQFAGIPNPLTPENTESQENFIRSIANYRFTNITTLTNFVVDTNGLTNIFITTNTALDDHLFVGGRFARFGGGFTRDDIRSRANIARLVGGETPGPGNIGFVLDNYSVDERAGQTFITLVRTNGSLAPISARFDALDRIPAGPGVATAGLDYQSTNYFPLWIRSYDGTAQGDRQYSDAYMGPNFNAFSTNRTTGDFTLYQFPDKPALHFKNYDEDNIFIKVFDDNVVEGDEVINLTLSAPDEGRLLLGGQPIPVGTALGKAHATLTIADDDFAYGTLGFSDPEYFVNENELNATVTVTRVGGSSGTVQVDVYTRDGTAGASDYTGITRKTITLANGQTSQKFTIPIKNDSVAELEESVLLFMTNAVGFPSNIPAAQRLDPARSTAVLTILDDDFSAGRISFTASTNSVAEGGGETTITVRRSGGTTGDLFVNYATVDGTARGDRDYTPVRGTLHWTDKDSSAKTFTIPILDNNTVEPDKFFSVALSNPTITGALGSQTNITVRIVNDDAAGTFSFSQAIYTVDENGPYADISVIREGGVSGTVTVHYAATNLTAIGSTNASLTFASGGIPDYVFPQLIAYNGFTNSLTFVEGQTAASFRIPLIDDSIVEGEKRVALSLFNATGGALLGNTAATLSIVDNELNNSPAGQLDPTFLAKGSDDYVYALALQSDGKIMVGGDFHFFNDVVRNRLARLQQDGTLDITFDPKNSPDNSVRTIDIEPNDRAVIGGLFTSIGGTNLNHIARLNIDSNVDPTFIPGAGTDNPIYSLVEQPDGKIVIGGSFSSYRGVSRRYIARVTTNGVLDVNFNPGTGANAPVWAVALQADGKVLIGGDFTTYNEIPRAHLARLNRDGTLDQTFNAGADASVRAIVMQTDGNILIGGIFTNVNGRPFPRIARLKSSGATPGQIDDTFTLGFTTDQARSTNGANSAVAAIAVQLDGKIVIGGDFTQFNGRTRNRISRLNSDGSLDPTINFGAGANGPVSTIVLQPDRKIILGGGFTEYDGSPARHIARIQGGASSGSGSLQFTSPFFSASETDENAVVNIRRTGGTAGTLRVTFLTTTNDTAVPGTDFRTVTNVVEFPEAETFRSVLIPLIRNTNALQDVFVTVNLTNVTGGGTLGNQSTARLTIVNSDSRIEFSRPDYSITENFVSGSASITIMRLGSTSGTVAVGFQTKDDTATSGADYGPVNTTITFAPGESSRTVAVPVFDDTVVEGNERVTLLLTNLVGNGQIGTPKSTLTIIDNDFSAGQVRFASTNFLGSEASGNIVVTVRRVGGTTGVISVDYATRPGGDNPAQPGSDYTEVRGIVAFADGEDTKTFLIPLVNDTLVEGNETIIVSLSNPKGGTSILGSTESTATIVDDDLPSGSLDRSFDPGTGANGEVRVVRLVNGSHVLIGGAFTTYNNQNRSHLARIDGDGGLDSSFDPGNGPDATVADIAVDPENKLIIGGGFNTVAGTLLNRVARLLPTGQVDPGFSLPLGLNAEVSQVVRQPDSKILIGGMFDMASAAGRNHIARLNADGTVDVGFNPGTGADGNVTAIALQPDGKILVGGLFSQINGTTRRGIARLNADGSLDNSFNPAGAGALGGGVQDILLLADGSIVITGDFTSYNNVNRSRVARLKADGSLDETFNPGVGPNRVVYAVARQEDGKFVIVGDFTSVSGATRTRVARLNADGSHDTEFRPGNGPNDAVLAVAIQPDDQRIVIGGRFTEVDNVPRAHIARLNNDKGFIELQPVNFSSVTLASGQFQMIATTQAGFSYVLESTSTLGGPWKQEQTVVAEGSSTVFSVDPSEQHQFFRIRSAQ